MRVGSLLAPPRERPVQHMRGQRTVLHIQDGSDLHFATWPGCDGLEVFGRNRTSCKTKGLHQHLTPEVIGGGLPLGVLHWWLST